MNLSQFYEDNAAWGRYDKIQNPVGAHRFYDNGDIEINTLRKLAPFP